MSTITESEKRYIQYFLDYILAHGVNYEDLYLEIQNIRQAARLLFDQKYIGLLANKLDALMHFASVEESFGNYLDAQQIYQSVINIFDQGNLKYDLKISAAYLITGHILRPTG
jgi:tetratricopeptide (TPR) repeat protein